MVTFFADRAAYEPIYSCVLRNLPGLIRSQQPDDRTAPDFFHGLFLKEEVAARRHVLYPARRE